jgi:uncharacterized protein (TIGR02145 family)
MLTKFFCHHQLTKLMIITFVFIGGFLLPSFAQVGIGTTTPNSSSILDLTSTNKGLILPRMTTIQRNTIVTPVAGMVVFNTDSDCIEIYRSSGWFNICSGTISTSITRVSSCGQTWMAKNLDVSTYRNGDIIPEVSDSAQWSTLTTGAWCWYNNDSATYGAIYGKLYNWYAVNDPRGLAPNGWHVPSNSEWNILVECLDSNADTTCMSCAQSSIAGGALKQTDTTYWLSPNSGATNSSGLTCLPAGHRYDYGAFKNIGEEADFWSSSTNVNNALYRFLSYYNSSIGTNSYGKANGFSVRCIKD